MFIRRTQTRTTATGATYFTHRLVRAERLGDKVRQRTLLNLGRHFEVSQNDWPVLCQRIEEVLSGQMRRLPDCPSELEAHAQHLARQAALSGAGTPPGEPDIQEVDMDSLELIRPRSGGVEHVGLWAMDQLGLRSCLHELGLKPSLCAAAIDSIIARMACPGSERAFRSFKTVDLKVRAHLPLYSRPGACACLVVYARVLRGMAYAPGADAVAVRRRRPGWCRGRTHLGRGAGPGFATGTG